MVHFETPLACRVPQRLLKLVVQGRREPCRQVTEDVPGLAAGIGVVFQRGETAQFPLVAVVIGDPDVADGLALVTRPGPRWLSRKYVEPCYWVFTGMSQSAAALAPDVNDFLDQAIRLAVASVADGGGPFGALVVTADVRTFGGVNRVTRDNDPTAHAEVVAIRRAAAATATFDLSGAVLYASGPCPLCLAAALWARVDRVHFAADRDAATAAGFDDAVFYEYFDGARATPGTDLAAADAGGTFDP